jgi:hypothetical protein
MQLLNLRNDKDVGIETPNLINGNRLTHSVGVFDREF